MDKRTTGEFRSIDVRWLKRQGLLVPETSHSIHRTERGQLREIMKVHARKQSLIIDRPHPKGERQACSIALESTDCNLGGTRPWFRCPSPFCDQRVAILYLAEQLKCRKCLGLIYATQNEGRIARMARRADQIRVQLGWPLGILGGPDRGKPTNMHWKKYDRLNQEFAELHRKLMTALTL